MLMCGAVIHLYIMMTEPGACECVMVVVCIDEGVRVTGEVRVTAR